MCIVMISGIVLMLVYLLYKDAIHQKGSMRSNDNGDNMSMMVGAVLSGFEYRAQKEKYDNYMNFLKIMKRNINIQALLKKQSTRRKTSGIKMNTFILHIYQEI